MGTFKVTAEIFDSVDGESFDIEEKIIAPNEDEAFSLFRWSLNERDDVLMKLHNIIKIK